MKGLKEITKNTNRKEEFKNIVDRFQIDNMFTEQTIDNDNNTWDHAVKAWIDNQTELIASNGFAQKKEEDITFTLPDVPEEYRQSIHNWDGISITFSYRHPQGAFSVAIAKLDEYRNSLPQNEENNAIKADIIDLVPKLTMLNWAVNTLRDLANDENVANLAEDSLEAKKFILAQTILQDIDSIKNQMDSLNEHSKYSQTGNEYFQYIERVVDTCEIAMFDMKDLERKVEVDAAYDKVIKRKADSIAAETDIKNKISDEIKSTIEDGYNPSMVLNVEYNNTVRAEMSKQDEVIVACRKDKEQKEKEYKDAEEICDSKTIDIINKYKELTELNAEDLLKALKN